MSLLFLITLQNIMPNRLLLLILYCLFWGNQISWCQICAIWHLLLLANYWRKDKLVMVHAAISAPCSKGTSFSATQYAASWNSVLGPRDKEIVSGRWTETLGHYVNFCPEREINRSQQSQGGADSKSNLQGPFCPVWTIKLILLKGLIWLKWLITVLLVPLT